MAALSPSCTRCVVCRGFPAECEINLEDVQRYTARNGLGNVTVIFTNQTVWFWLFKTIEEADKCVAKSSGSFWVKDAFIPIEFGTCSEKDVPTTWLNKIMENSNKPIPAPKPVMRNSDPIVDLEERHDESSVTQSDDSLKSYVVISESETSGQVEDDDNNSQKSDAVVSPYSEDEYKDCLPYSPQNEPAISPMGGGVCTELPAASTTFSESFGSQSHSHIDYNMSNVGNIMQHVIEGGGGGDYNVSNVGNIMQHVIEGGGGGEGSIFSESGQDKDSTPTFFQKSDDVQGHLTARPMESPKMTTGSTNQSQDYNNRNNTGSVLQNVAERDTMGGNIPSSKFSHSEDITQYIVQKTSGVQDHLTSQPMESVTNQNHTYQQMTTTPLTYTSDQRPVNQQTINPAQTVFAPMACTTMLTPGSQQIPATSVNTAANQVPAYQQMGRTHPPPTGNPPTNQMPGTQPMGAKPVISAARSAYQQTTNMEQQRGPPSNSVPPLYVPPRSGPSGQAGMYNNPVGGQPYGHTVTSTPMRTNPNHGTPGNYTTLASGQYVGQTGTPMQGYVNHQYGQFIPHVAASHTSPQYNRSNPFYPPYQQSLEYAGNPRYRLPEYSQFQRSSSHNMAGGQQTRFPTQSPPNYTGGGYNRPTYSPRGMDPSQSVRMPNPAQYPAHSYTEASHTGSPMSVSTSHRTTITDDTESMCTGSYISDESSSVVDTEDAQSSISSVSRSTKSRHHRKGRSKDKDASVRKVVHCSHVITVKDLNPDTADQTLEDYFGNPDESGGDDIVQIIRNDRRQAVNIVFKTVEVVERIMRKKKHCLDDYTLKVTRCVERPLDKKKAHIYNYGDTVTEEALVNFIEAKSKSSVEKITFGENNNGLVIFSEDSDLEQLVKRCQKDKLEGHQIKVASVMRPNSIRVTGFDPKTTKDSLRLYFGNRKNGGGMVEEIEFNKDEECCIIYFEDFNVVDDLCARTHSPRGQPLDVRVYYDFLGAVSGDGSQISYKEPAPCHVTLTGDDVYKMQLLRSSDPNRKAMDDALSNVFGQIDYNNKLQNEVIMLFKLHPDGILHRIPEKKWVADVEKTFWNVLKTYIVDVKIIQEEIWDNVTEKVRSIENGDKDSIVYHAIAERHSIVVVYLAGEYTYLEAISDILQSESKALERKRNEVTEVVSLNEKFKSQFLSETKFHERHAKEGLTIKFDVKAAKMTVTGQPDDVRNCKMLMYQEIGDTVSNPADISQLCKKLLLSNECEDYLLKKIQQRNVIGVWNIQGENTEQCHVTVHAATYDNVLKVSHVINTSLKVEKILLREEAKPILVSESWLKAKQGILSQHEGLVLIEDENSEITVASSAEISEDIVKGIHAFLETNTKYGKPLSFDSPWSLEFVKRHNIDLLRAIDIKIDFQGATWVLNGTSGQIDEATEQIAKLVSSVSSAKKRLTYIGISKFFNSEDGKAYLKRTEENRKCIIAINSTEAVNIAAKDEVPFLAHRQSVGNKPRLRLFLTTGELAKTQVEVLVNSTNKDLQLTDGAVSKSLSDAAGAGLQLECQERYATGMTMWEIVQTSGHELPCSYIFHVCLEHCSRSVDNPQKMKDVVLAVLMKAHDQKLKSIAFPPLGAGQLQYPGPLVAEIMYSAVSEFCTQNAQTSLQDVQFILYAGASPVVEAFAIEHQKQKREALAAGSRTISFMENIPDPKAPAIRIKQCHGMIEAEKVDVIVCTTNKELKLKNTSLSRKILAAAGDGIQAECTEIYPSGIGHGDLVVTKAHNMTQAKHVYLSSLPNYKPGKEQVLKKFVFRCLETANDVQLKSIAFPPLGTENQHYPLNMVAKTMYRAVQEFMGRHPWRTLELVSFVLHPDDAKVIQAFEEELQHQPSGQVATTAGSEAAFKVGNISLQVLSGDIIQARTDAIVNSSNSDLDLTKGAVSQSLLLMGGDDLKNECATKVADIQAHSVAVTKAYHLDCDQIIHVVVNASDMKQTVTTCLDKAKEMKLSSLAFPAIGTGGLGQTPEVFAEAIANAILAQQTTESTLKMVDLVIYQKKMVKPVVDKLATKLTKLPTVAQHIPKVTNVVPTFTEDNTRGGNVARSFTSSFKGISANARQSVLTVDVFSSSQKSIDDAISDLHDKCTQQTTTNNMLQEAIQFLNETQVAEIQKLANDDLKIEVLVKEEKITLSGLNVDVLTAENQIKDIILKVEKVRKQFFQFEWGCLSGSEVELYPDNINFKLEQAYQRKETHCKFEADGLSVVVDLINLQEYYENDPGDLVRVVRKDKYSAAGAAGIPATWTQMNGKNMMAVDLSPTDKEYMNVKALFNQSSGGSHTISSIKRIQNESIYGQYAAKKREMENKASDKSHVERVLWHGTSADTIEALNNLGFNRSFCGKNATVYGNGVYFAVAASLSCHSTYSRPDANGNKHVYMADVLTGEFTAGQSGMRTLPPKNPAVPEVTYDSLADRVASPTMFIIFHDAQAYPKYLIKFK